MHLCLYVITVNVINWLLLSLSFSLKVITLSGIGTYSSSILQWKDTSPGGLNLSRRGLDRDSRSRHRKKVSLDGRENLDQKISILKISTEKKKVDLDMMDNLDGFQKLVSTRWTFSISISPPGLKDTQSKYLIDSLFWNDHCKGILYQIDFLWNVVQYYILKIQFCLCIGNKFFLQKINNIKNRWK